ncbi:TSC22 domain family protein 2 isoform X1 [Antechinus flavipes]|uniref:TSC22 domain family protein 2 isoform X1 n=1 Tax=Antechinus flavipes TaxID=38775 RepID=UPI0022369F60|nr:TSC22 domain family protein 2 isoform X1 [Antechinus flavipes]
MSKMPAKKKSCFQITSVTTAQVASSITEDTESLDDPDESHTEDVSSEIFDVSRATDYGPEEVCERSSSEETLNNVGDAETPGTVSPNLLLDGQLAAAAAAGGGPASGGAAVNPRNAAGPPPGAPHASASAAGLVSGAGAQTPATCSSRFRVIKLDHGSGEPYRRGRWTCMEYYDRDSDGGVLTRTGDCIRHSTSAFEPGAERDSGLGATSGSVVVSAAPTTQSSDPGGDGSAALPADKGHPPPAPPAQHLASPSPAPLYPAATNGKGSQQVQPPAAAGTPPQPFATYGQPAGPPQPGQPDYGPHVAALQPPASGSGPEAAAQPPKAGTPLAASVPLTQPQASGGRGAGGPPAQGPSSGPASLAQALPGAFQTQPQPLAGPADETRRKSEPLPQPPLSLLAESKPPVKAPLPDALAGTPMNSLASTVFGISIPVDGDEDRNPSTAFYQAFHLNKLQESKTLWDSASGASVVAIDNKIEQAMDLVKSHLMYAVREEVEVLKEQIKELVERNSLLERENALLKSLSNNDQLSQLSTQQANPSSTSQQQTVIAQPPQPTQPPQQPNVSSA